MKYSLDQTLCSFNGREKFSLRDACEGVSIMGGIGSGKTSGSGATLARAYLESGFGGLVLCAKKDEAESWMRYAYETGRQQSIIRFDASGTWRFPFLQYEVERGGAGAGNTENLVRLFTTINDAVTGSQTGGSDPYWPRAMEQLIRNAIDLCLLSRHELSIPTLSRIVATAPGTRLQAEEPEWFEESVCGQLLKKMSDQSLDPYQTLDAAMTADYWTKEICSLAPKQRSGITSMFTSMADLLNRRPFRMLFSMRSPKGRDLMPEFTHTGAVILLDLPVKEFGMAGQLAQLIYKYMWQQAVERRDISDDDQCPVFLWCDEAQNFVTEYDMQFQATARSSRACTVYLSQNLPNYYAAMGGEHSRHRVDSLIGNLQTRIWHSNGDPETNRHAADTIGRSWHQSQSDSKSASNGGFNISRSQSESFDYDVPPQTFTRLRKGGPENDLQVEGIVYQTGRRFSNGKTWMLAAFQQQ
jgi:hypothetical protein